MAILRLLRVHHWTKNLLLFAPIFFAGGVLNEFVIKLFLGLIAFCFASSTVYIINDFMDLDLDRLHANRKNRPLASGLISVKTSFILVTVLVLSCGAILYFLPLTFSYIIFTYIFINILYSIWLKHIAILDVTIIASGFLLRLSGGGLLAEVELSKWIILLTFFAALLIAVAKRRNELLMPNAAEIRPSLKGYSLKYTDAIIALLSGVCLVFYIMYTIDPEVTNRLNSQYVYFTVIFVLLGFLRYLQQVFIHNDAGSPVHLLAKDHWLKLLIFLWLSSFYYLLYV